MFLYLISKLVIYLGYIGCMLMPMYAWVLVMDKKYIEFRKSCELH